MCFRVNVLIFTVTLLLHNVLSDDLMHLPCHTNVDCAKYTVDHIFKNSTCIQGSCICFDKKINEIPCKLADFRTFNKVGGPCPCNVPHATCNNTMQQCLCEKSYIASQDGRSCIKERVVLNGTCEFDSQCHQYDYFTECHKTFKTCRCQSSYTEFEEHCYSVVGLGGKCNANDECLNQVLESFCWKNECVCSKGFVSTPDNTMCLLGADYGQTCNSTSQCRHKLGVGSVCDLNNICVCDKRHKNYTVDGETKCMKIRAYGDSCFDHNDCFEYDLAGVEQRMECYTGQCFCRKGYAEYDFQCISINGSNQNSVNRLLVVLVVATTLWAAIWSLSKLH